MAPNYIALALALLAAAVLISGLFRIINTMRLVAGDLETVRLLLRTVANQTEPVSGWVSGIEANVSGLSEATADLLARTALRVGVVRPASTARVPGARASTIRAPRIEDAST